MTEPRAIILMYHRVVDTDVDPWGLCVSPAHFDGQLAALAELAPIVPLQAFVDSRASGALAPVSVVLTFDDGYRDNVANALPALERHQAHATLFVTTGNLGRSDEFWWDALDHLLLGAHRLPARLELEIGTWDLGAAVERTHADVHADKGLRPWMAAEGSRLWLYSEVWKALWPLSETVRSAALREISLWSGIPVPEGSERRTISLEELDRATTSPYLTVGAHTIDHPPLDARDEEEQARQIAGSRSDLGSLAPGAELRSFAYPHGRFSQATTRLVGEAGFDHAVTVEHAVADRASDPLRLPRFAAPDVPGEVLAERVRGWLG